MSRTGRLVGLLLWVLALVLALGVLVYQRRTGPTYPLRVAYELEGVSQKARLIRSGNTDTPARVALPVPPGGWSGQVIWRRYPTDDEYAAIDLVPDAEGSLIAELPVQPAAGKLTYFVKLTKLPGGGAVVRVPAEAGADPILRYKDPVPRWVILPHIVVMILTFSFAMRTALSALFARRETTMLAWLTFGLLTLGGLILGPITQKYAFGEFWTGWPRGYDVTDNKALIGWVVWLLACGVLLVSRGRRPLLGRLAVLGAFLVMLVVYLIPHSLRGSELDYRQLEDGVAPKDAIRTG